MPVMQTRLHEARVIQPYLHEIKVEIFHFPSCCISGIPSFMA
jgi:hypothetical protein